MKRIFKSVAIWIVVGEALIAFVLWCMGFRITYAPELDNNWDAISAVAEWAGVVVGAFATHALTSGVDAKTLSGILGHTNASFTLDTYTHVTSDMQKTASGIVGGFMEDIFGKELKPWQESEKPETEP